MDKPPSSPPRNRTILQSWLVLPARTRLYLSLGICLVGATGLMVSDYLENTAIPVVKEKEKLAQAKIATNSTTSTFSPEPEATSKNY